MNLITWKIPYHCSNDLFDIIKQYNNILHFTYNRLLENPKISTKDLTALQKTANRSDFIKSHLLNSAIYNARAIIEKSDEPIIFGGKTLFKKRCKKAISHKEFVRKRLSPLTSIGEANYKGNRLFQILDKNTILFKLNRNLHFILNINCLGNKRSKEIKKLLQLQDNKALPITYKLDLDFIYITFDYNKLKTYTYNIKQNRVFAIDMNPNSIGWSVVDWVSEDKYNLIQAGTFSLKELNDYQTSLHLSSDNKKSKYITNKRKHEVIHIAKQLFELCKHYHCEVFSIEQLNMKSSDRGLGRRVNKQVNNNWDRGLLTQQIRKYINASSTILIEVQPQWNSYIGNLVFRQEHLPDECLASIEIGRRGFEFSTQYIFSRRPHKKTVIFPELELFKSQLALSLEELSIDVHSFDSWKDILFVVKKSKVKYRFSTSEAQKLHSESLFSKFYKQKYLFVYKYL